VIAKPSQVEPKRPNATEEILRFERVNVSFDEVHALQDVSFRITRGQARIIFGAAGSGKSVALKTALGLIRPDSGRVYLFGEDVTDYTEEQLFEFRARIGVLFQEGGLFDSLTIEENVAYPIVNRNIALRQAHNGDVQARVKESLTFVELGDTLAKFPSELSGGMRRRVGIARAMVTNPALMLYDSPTAGLDPITANTIIALIIKARDTSETTTLVVTHRYQDGHLLANFRYNPESGQVELAPADSGVHARTIFMVFQEGRLVFEGTQEQLEQQTDPYIAKFKLPKS
jgi:phospholipid/cholesterol/gamma-HCH transport system ATP-binding protein